MDTLRSLAFRTLSTPDPVIGISVIQAACIEGNFEDFQLITSLSPSLVDTVIAITTTVLEKGRSEYAKKTPEKVVTMQGSPSHLAIRDLLQQYTKATENTSLLHLAARQGSVPNIRRLVAQGENINAVAANADKENDLSTPLGLAAAYNKLEVVEELLSQGADVHAKDGRLFTAAHRAAMNGRTNVLLYLLDKMDKRTILSGERFNIGLLHVAAYGGHTYTAAALISFGADVNERMALSIPDAYAHFYKSKYSDVRLFGWALTPFLMAAAVGQVDVAQLLVSKGANIHATSLPVGAIGAEIADPFHSRNAMYHASSGGHLEMLQYLVKVGFQVPRGVIGRSKRTLLHVAKNSECAEFFIEHGLDVNALSYGNRTPLHEAILRGDVVAAEFLLKHGAYVEESLPLHTIKYRAGDAELVKVLIERGCSVNRRDDNQKTPLHWAAGSSSQSFEVSKVLITEGADVNAKDSKDRLPLHYATKEKYDHQMADNLVQLLLEHGSGVNIADYKGNTPLHYAAYNKCAAATKTILDHGGSLETANCAGQLPLHVACQRKTTSSSTKVVKVLIDYAVSKDKSNQTLSLIMNSKDKYGRTALHEAAKGGNVETVQLLLDHGSDVNAVDSKQQSILQYAETVPDKNAARLLLKHGANRNIRKKLLLLFKKKKKKKRQIPNLLLPEPEDKVQTESEESDW